MGATMTSPVNFVKIKTGIYTGNNIDNRNIDIGVNLAAKSCTYVIIKQQGNRYAHHRIEYGQGDGTMSYHNIVDVPDFIQSFTATGFQIGSSDSLNAGTIIHRYIAFWLD